MRKGVFPHEGGYTNDPRDPGGPTNWGITLNDARHYWKANASAVDVETMPKSVAEAIYLSHYAAPLRYADLPAGVDYAVLDYGINSGIARAARVLRALVGASAGTVIGDDIVALVKQRNARLLIQAIDDERLRFLRSLTNWDHFGPGWGRRVAEVNALALAFANSAANDNQPQATATGKGETMAKGEYPKPNIVAHVGTAAGGVVAGGAAIELRSGGVFSALWAHPYISVSVAAAALGIALLVIDRVFVANDNKQTMPMPGTVAVPVSAFAKG